MARGAVAGVSALDHVTVAVPAADFAARAAIYDAAFGAIGLVRLHELVDEEEDDRRRAPRRNRSRRTAESDEIIGGPSAPSFAMRAESTW